MYVISENAARLATSPPIKPVTRTSNKLKSSLRKKYIPKDITGCVIEM